MPAVIEPVDARNASAYRPLATGLHGGQLTLPLPGLIALGAAVDSEPAGLCVARVRPDTPPVADLLHLHIAPPHRLRGIATELLRAAEAVALAEGCATIRATVAEGTGADLAARALMQRLGWARLRHVRTLYKVPYHLIGHAAWVTRRQSWPEGYQVFPWREISDADRDAVRSLADRAAIDTSLDPLSQPERQTGNSIGLRVRGAVAGWAVSHVHGDGTTGTMIGPRLFVRDDLQRRGFGAMLLAEHVQGCPANGIDHAVFHVEAGNDLMMRLMRRSLRPYVSAARDVWEVGRALRGTSWQA